MVLKKVDVPSVSIEPLRVVLEPSKKSICRLVPDVEVFTHAIVADDEPPAIEDIILAP